MPDAPDILVRRSRVDDAEAILAIRRHPITRRHQPLVPGTLADLRQTLGERAALPLAPTTDGKVQWTVELGGTVCGWLSVDVTSRGHHVASVGYSLAPAFHGRGIMPATLAEVIPIAFDPAGLALERLEAVAAAGNMASRRVLEKCGFRYEGIARGLLIISGRRVDHARYGLLRSDMMPRNHQTAQGSAPCRSADPSTRRGVPMPPHDPISFELIADRVTARSPRVSPQGDAVAWVRRYLSTADDRATSQVWLTRDGGEPFAFTSGKAGASDPEWSPDGRLAFLSTRDDADDQAGIFVIRSDGGEARQVGNLRGKISQPRWSPDGRRIAFLMHDPETEAEKKDTEKKRDWIRVEEDVKHVRLWTIDPDTGTRRCLTPAGRSVIDYAWAPDSRELVIVTTPLPTPNARFDTSRLARVPAAGGIETEIATFPMAPASPVVREIDGRRVIALAANDHRNDPSPSIWVIAWDGSHRRNLLPELRGIVEQVVADPTDPASVLAVIVEGTHGRLYCVSLATGKRELLSPGELAERGSVEPDLSASADGRKVAFVWSASDEPNNVWSITRDGSTAKVSALDTGLDDRLVRAEIVTWPSYDGVEIEGLLYRPAGVEGPAPLFVEVHGGPAWQWEDRLMLSWHDWAQMLVSRGWAVLMPNPRGSTGYGSAFEKLLQDDVGFGESKDLVAGAQAMVQRGIADGSRLAIGGWSWGGYLTARTITQTRLFKAAVMGAGVANLASDHGAGDIPNYNTLIHPGHPYDERTWEFYAKGSPVREASKVTTPTLILHGDADDRVHPTQGQEFFRALQQAGVPVRFVRYPREGHPILEREHQLDLMEQIVAWLEKWVPRH